MEKLTFSKVVGFILATAFAITIGVSTWALMVGDYMDTNLINEQTQHSVRIVGFAGLLAALVAWWCQRFVAHRGFLVRMLFALFIFLVAFCSFGGFLRFAYIHATYPSQVDWSLGGLYASSLNDFYTFLLDMLLPPRLGFVALAFGAAIYIALFGIREPRTVEL